MSAPASLAVQPSVDLPLGRPAEQPGLSDQDARWIEAQVKAAGTSFYWGMRVLPADKRAAMFAIYAFARAVDDIADEGGTAAQKTAALAEWRRELDRIYGEAGDDAPRSAIGLALADAYRRFGVRKQDFLALIDGMESDALTEWAGPTRVELELYCDRVATAVGLLSVRVFGTPEAVRDDIALNLGRALQLTNILRDIGEDAERGRLYLPGDLLDRHGITSRNPADVLTDPRLPDLCRDLLAEAGAYFDRADALMDQCPPQTVRPARLMKAVYYKNWEAMRDADFRDPARRLSVPKWKKLWIALRYGLL